MWDGVLTFAGDSLSSQIDEIEVDVDTGFEMLDSRLVVDFEGMVDAVAP